MGESFCGVVSNPCFKMIVLPSRFFRGEDYIKENSMKEYTAKVSFYINVMASDKDIARISLLNQLQFPGHVVSELDIKIKDLPDDKQVCQGFGVLVEKI